MSGTLFIISAPSGAGKTTIVTAALNRLKPSYTIDRLVTYTSKQPRCTELNGIDYHFVTQQEFEQRMREGFFLEWSTAYGNYYGTPRHIVHDLAAGQSFFLIIDRVGTQHILQHVPAVAIWIYTHNADVLRERLLRRNTEQDAHVEYRLAQALAEINAEAQKRMYHHHILNDDLESAVDAVTHIVHSTFGLLSAF